MKIDFTPRGRKDYESLPQQVRKQAKKQLNLLGQDVRYPSLNAKKYPEAGAGVWQGRVNRDYRFYFVVETDRYVVLRIVPHPK